MLNFSKRFEAKEKEDGKIVSFYLDRELAKKIDFFCHEKKISKSQFAREALTFVIDKYVSQKDAGFVYFAQLQGNPAIKIGKTTNVDRRLDDDIAKGLPVPVDRVHIIETMNHHETEKLFHNHFRYQRRSDGEWFDLTEKDIQWIKNREYLKVDQIRRSIDGF